MSEDGMVEAASEDGVEIYNDGEIQVWRYSWGVEMTYCDSGEGVALTEDRWVAISRAISGS